MQKVNLENFIVLSAWEQKDWKKSRKNTSADQWRSKKSGKNEGWHEKNYVLIIVNNLTIVGSISCDKTCLQQQWPIPLFPRSSYFIFVFIQSLRRCLLIYSYINRILSKRDVRFAQSNLRDVRSAPKLLIIAAARCSPLRLQNPHFLTLAEEQDGG